MSHRPGIRNFPVPSITRAAFGMTVCAAPPMIEMRSPVTTTVVSGRAGAPVASITVTCVTTRAAWSARDCCCAGIWDENARQRAAERMWRPAIPIISNLPIRSAPTKTTRAAPHGDCQVYRLSANLNAVAVRVEYNALVVAVAGTPWAIDNRDAVFAQTPGEFIDNLFRTHAYREMRKTQPLSSRGRLHQ